MQRLLRPAGRPPAAYSRIPTGAPIGGDDDMPALRSGGRPRTEREEEEMLLSYMQAALGEWGMDMSDLDTVKSVRPEGMMTASEKKTRGL